MKKYKPPALPGTKKGLSIFTIIVSLLLLSLLIVFLMALTQTPGDSSGSLPSFFQMGRQNMPLIFLFALAIFVIAFVNTDVALIILIFSMLLSPELRLVEVTQKAVVVRIDDILLGVVFLGWLVRIAVHKELGLIKQTSLNPLIIGYIVVCVVATVIGILTGRVTLARSFFFILKYFEYFLLYFMVTNIIRDRQQVENFVTAFLIAGLIICVFGITQIGAISRTTAPFEGESAEPNTLGGYLLLLFSVCVGIFLYSPSSQWMLFAGALACLILPPFIFTLSRSSYFSFIPMYLAFIIFSQKKKFFLIISMIGVVTLGPILVPQVGQVIRERVVSTFDSRRTFDAFGKSIPLESSAAARVYSWQRVFKQWVKRPILGYGVTGVGLVDAQYPRVLGETGIIGFALFIFLLSAIFRRVKYIFKTIRDDWAKGLALGLLAGFIGLLFHALAANTFIIVRIMMPFWFLLAIVISLPRIYGSLDEAQPQVEVR
ncbi:O-antigen ligase family protein [Candidatus Omnitrophota bacterium]